MLQVDDVAAASRWYQTTLGLTSGHGGDEYEMLFDGDEFVLQLHRIDAHEHGFLTPDGSAVRGAGVSLWFELADREAVESLVAAAREADTRVVSPPQWNPLAHHHEATLVDPDGYLVVVHSPFEPGT